MEHDREPTTKTWNDHARRRNGVFVGFLEEILFEVGSGQKCLFSSLSEFLWYTSSTATYSPTYETLDDNQQELVQVLFHVDEQIDEMKLCCYVRACRENLQHRTTKILNTQLEAIGNFSVEEDKVPDLDKDKIADLHNQPDGIHCSTARTKKTAPTTACFDITGNICLY
jgi:hypothetical protein